MTLVFIAIYFKASAVRPTLIVGLVIGLAALSAPLSESGIVFGSVEGTTVIRLLFFLISVLSVFTGFASPKYSLIPHKWRNQPLQDRLLVAVMVILTSIATFNTLVSEAKAASHGFVIISWILALSGGFWVRQGSERMYDDWFLTKCAGLALLVGLFARYAITGRLLIGGRDDVALSVMSIAAASIAIASQNPVRMVIGAAIATISLVALVLSFPTNQSLAVGSLFGIAWMLIIRQVRKRRNHRSRKSTARWVAAIAMGSIFIMPILTMLLYLGRSGTIAQKVINAALTITGENEINLLDRPRRWAVLLADTINNPLRIRFTNFVDIEYEMLPGLYESVFPHNIVITAINFLGFPGGIICIYGIFRLIQGLVDMLMRDAISYTPGRLGGVGVVMGLLFRNMWSNALITWPLEGTLFWTAVFAAWATGTEYKDKCSEMADFMNSNMRGNAQRASAIYVQRRHSETQ